MAFCVKCGMKQGRQARFCPKCGTQHANSTAPNEIQNTLIKRSNTASKKLALFLTGLTVLAAIAAGVWFLPKMANIPSSISVSAAEEVIPMENSGMEVKDIGIIDPVPTTLESNPELMAYQNVVTSGRISQLGQFLQDYPDSKKRDEITSLAFASLQRQNTEIAHQTFIKFFPEYDLSGYPRAEELALNVDSSLEFVTPEISVSVGDSVETEVSSESNSQKEGYSVETENYLISREFGIHIEAGNIDYAESILRDVLDRPTTTERDKALIYSSLSSLFSEGPEEMIENLRKALSYNQLSVSEETSLRKQLESLEKAKAEFGKDTLKPISRSDFKISVSDRRASPLNRMPARVPSRAEKSGHCLIQFDVDSEGKTTNIREEYCTERYFARAAIRSIQESRYLPAISNGVAVMEVNLEQKVNFRLLDEEGNTIPE